MAQSEISEIIKKVRLVEIKTKFYVDNLFQSAYASVFKGKGLEFSEVREYQYGDDVRTIDWNVSARMGRLYVKQFVEERDLTIYILFDASGSTHSGTANALKKEVMTELCASLAYTAFRNNDRVGLLLFTDRIEEFIPPKKGRAQVYKIIREVLVHDLKSRGTDVSVAFDYLLKVNKGVAIIFLISDLHGPSYLESSDLFARLSKKNDMIVLRITDPVDFEIPDAGLIQFLNPETGDKILVDTSDPKIRENYRKISLQRETEIKKMLKTKGIDLIEVSTAEDYFKPLMRFFKIREKRLRRVAA
jgi:uncharacterized protein (DUF58 family)